MWPIVVLPLLFIGAVLALVLNQGDDVQRLEAPPERLPLSGYIKGIKEEHFRPMETAKPR